MLKNFAGKRVLVTGHTGFKGAWLSLWLTSLGAKVSGYALAPPTQPNLFDALNLADSLDHNLGDLRDLPALKEAVGKAKPEIVFHLAAQPLVLESYADPVGTFATNVMGTVNLLEAVRCCDSVKAVVCVTSDKCYENREWLWGYRECDPMGGWDPYSASKGACEIAIAAYRRSFFCEGKHPALVASARAGNVIGGGDWGKDRLIPDCVRSFAQGKAVEIRSPGSIRPWQHVFDPLKGYMLLGEKLLSGDAKFATGFNFGPTDIEARTVLEVVRELSKGFEGSKFVVTGNPAEHEAKWLRLDASKAVLELGFAPGFGFDAAIKATAEWYKYFYAKGPGAGLREFSLNQLKMYGGRELA